MAVLEADEESEATVMCLCGQQIVKKPLNECVSMVSISLFSVFKVRESQEEKSLFYYGQGKSGNFF